MGYAIRFESRKEGAAFGSNLCVKDMAIRASQARIYNCYESVRATFFSIFCVAAKIAPGGIPYRGELLRPTGKCRKYFSPPDRLLKDPPTPTRLPALVLVILPNLTIPAAGGPLVFNFSVRR